MPDFSFRPVSAPDTELIRCYGPDAALEFEVIDHLGQLAAALARGSIGFQSFTALSQQELARVGWEEPRGL